MLLFFKKLKVNFFTKQNFNEESLFFSCIRAKKVRYLQAVTVMNL